MTAKQSEIERRQLFNAIRKNNEFGNSNFFSMLLNIGDLGCYGGEDPDWDLQSVLFGEDFDDDNGAGGGGGQDYVKVPSLNTIILSDKLKGQLGNDLLHYAACCGNSFIVKCLIRLGVPVNVFDHTFNTPLMSALQGRQANEETIKTLLDLGATIYGSKGLQMCVSRTLKHWKSTRSVLEHVKRDCFNKSDVMAEKLLEANCMICHAVLWKDVEILRIMLRKGCSISASDPETRRTALHVAVLVKDLDTVKFLLENGADINVEDVKGKSPFTLALDYGESIEECEILNYLLDQGSSLNLRQQKYVLSKGEKRIVFTLLSRQCVDFNVRDVSGKASLHYIAQNRHLDKDQRIVEYLQQHRIDVNVLDNDNQSPLMFVASSKNVSLTKYLLQNGANVNEQNNLNASALYYLASKYQYNCNLLEVLLLYGADSQLSYINNVQDLTVIDKIIETYNYNYAKPILAYLVLHVANGGEIAQFIRRKIDSDEKLRNEFELCQKNLEDMKKIKVNGSLTAYKLMLDSEKKIMLTLRNEGMFTLLKNFYSTFNSDSYYIHLLKQRLEKIFLEIKVRQRATDILCKFFTIDYFEFPHIIDKIIDYLDPQDLQIVFHM